MLLVNAVNTEGRAVEVYVRDGKGMGRDIQYLRQGGSQIGLRGSCSCFVLCQAHISRLLWKAQRHTEIFLRHAPQGAEKVNALSNRHNGQLPSGFLINSA